MISFTDIPAFIRKDHVFKPTPAHRATYDEAFETYRKLHEHLPRCTSRCTVDPVLRYQGRPVEAP
jgi:hypothetical protein